MEHAMNGELRTFRKEIKYVVPTEKALLIKSRLDHILQRDAYCADAPYLVRSLYFESVNNTDFSDKIAGVEVRKKIRLRIYNGDSSLCKLEIKQKNGDLQRKNSILVSSDDAAELSRGNYQVLRNYFSAAPASMNAYAILTQGCYRPVVQIEYDRLAYRYPMYDTRITLDSNVRSSETNLDILSPGVNYTPILDQETVLEVKYSGKLMGFISAMLDRYHLTQESYSKYCAGRKIYYDFIW